MSTRWLSVSLLPLCLAACSKSPQKPPTTQDPHEGGTIKLAQCGYSVSTVTSATVPILAPSTLGPDPTPKLVHVNVANDPRTSMAILWRTNDETTLATTVQYGINGKTDQTQQGLTFSYDLATPTAAGLGAIQMHETHLCGLMPNTTYSYRVGGSDGTKSAWSPAYTFHTLPDSPDASVTMLLIGDTRGGYSTWGQTLKTAVEKGAPDLILFSGDETTLGLEQDEWDSWFTAVDPLLASTPMIVAHGNHEVNAVNFFSQFAMPGDEQNFTVAFASLHLTVANDTPSDPSQLTGPIATTLGQNLAAGAGATWNLLLHHKGLFSSSPAHTADAMTMRAAWQGIIDANHVDVDFNGHDHDYERSFPMRGTTVGTVPSDGTIYVVVGSAGAELYPAGKGASTAFSESTYSFAVVNVGKHMLQHNAFRGDGSALDSFMITK